MARPSPALRQWLNLRRSLSGASPRAQNLPANGLLPRANLLFPISNKDSCPSRQAFHSSACRLAKTKRSSAKPAPSLQRKKRAQEAGRSASRPVIDGIGVVSNSGLFTKSIEIDKARIIHDFLEISPLLYRDAVAAELLPGVSIRTFEDVIIKILKGMEGPPNAQLIRSISKDVDAVYRIGIVGSAWHHSSIEWFSSSCALAGARAAVVLLQARLVNWTHSPPQTQWTELVKQFSDEGFPPAMILQAKILGLCGQYAEAFELMEKRVLPFLEPTRRRPPLFLDITMDDVFESPWRVYALLHASYDDAFDSPESRQKADEATRIAALEYNDRNALIEYASIMMSEKKYDKYEESMSKAATLGSKKAILYIANFYYQVYLGRFPTAANVHASAKSQSQDPPPAEVTTNAPTSSDQPGPSSKANSLTSVFGWISSFFNQSIPRPAYRNLALDWYYLGHAYKIPQASFMLALMAHEEGEPLENSDFLMNGCKYLDDHPEFGPRIAELKENWYNTRYVPRLSSKMLTVR